MKKLLFMSAMACLLLAGCSDNDDDGGNGGGNDGGAGIVIDDGQKQQALYADQTGGSIKFTAADSWTASVEAATRAGADWLTLDKTSGSAGEATIGYTLGLNTTAEDRTASIAVASGGETTRISVTQKALTEDNRVPFTGRLLKRVTTDDFTREYTYDADGNLTSVTIIDSYYGEDVTWELTLGKDKITGLCHTADGREVGDTEISLRDGRIVGGSELDPGYDYRFEWTAAYDGLYVNKLTCPYDGEKLNESSYRWSGGNLSHATVAFGYGITWEMDFDYFPDVKLNSNMDLNFLTYRDDVMTFADEIKLAALGYYGRNKNLVKASTVSYTSTPGHVFASHTYTYEFDGEGYVLSCDVDTVYELTPPYGETIVDNFHYHVAYEYYE
ncbi:MAG: hypothetical protein LUE26_11425 [Alistipes sp.]|nr:hypothetical protein [Alistipes sp.]